jgi:predicted RNA-binding protein with PIN domain
VREHRDHLVVDGNNVMGATPDGWWRDRPGAVRRLLGRLQALAELEGVRVTLVLDRADPGLPEGDHDCVTVLYARRRGRDAADGRIRELVAEAHDGIEHDEAMTVVTSDRALAHDVGRRVAVTGAGSLLRRLDDAGC